MKIRNVTFDRLNDDEIAAWSAIQRATPAFSSPFFRPEFTQAVAAVRDNVEVAVLTDGAQPIGFLPFQRSRGNVGHPVGGKLSDFQGLIAPANISCSPLELLRACGLKVWHFDHLLSEQRLFSPFVRREADSPFVDLSAGMDAYLGQRKNGRSFMSEYRGDSRKLTRDVGPIRFEAHTTDRAICSTLLAWKSDQIRHMGTPNILDYSWVRNLLDKILEYHGDDFSAVMSVLYAGDKVAAIHFGMRTGEVLHAWFPAYSIELARYSPGFLCWIETLKAADSLGIRRIDFGKGSQGYKHRLMSGVTQVAEGTADLRYGATAIRRALWSARDGIRTSPLAAPARLLVQKIRRVRHWVDARIDNQRSCA